MSDLKTTFDELKGLEENIRPAFSTNPFNSSQETKNPLLDRIDEDLTTKSSAPGQLIAFIGDWQL